MLHPASKRNNVCVCARTCPCSRHCLAVQYRGAGRPASDGATCSRCGRRRRCPGLISFARGAAAWLPGSTPGEYLFHQVCVCEKFDSRVDGGSVDWNNNVLLWIFPAGIQTFNDRQTLVRLRPSLCAFLELGPFRLPPRPEWPSRKGTLTKEAEHRANDMIPHLSNERPHATNRDV